MYYSESGANVTATARLAKLRKPPPQLQEQSAICLVFANHLEVKLFLLLRCGALRCDYVSN